MSKLTRTAAIAYIGGTALLGTTVGVSLHHARIAAADPTHRDHRKSLDFLAGLELALHKNRKPPTLNKVATVAVFTWPVWTVMVAVKKISSTVHITIEHH